MKSFQFSVRVYIKGTRLTPFIMPHEGMYRCNWTPAGICRFEGIEKGYVHLYRHLEDNFDMDEKVVEGGALIEYYDRTREDLRAIGSQEDFETALRHSSETYSPFSLVIKVNAKRREEHWYNGEMVSCTVRETVRFGSAWRVSKPKFSCIRAWLVDLERDGKVCKNVLEACSYGEKAFLYAQFGKQGSQNLTNTNHNPPQSKMDQSNQATSSLTSIKRARPVALELLEPANEDQKMLQEKMMMDPVISLILFNEYIPLKSPARRHESSSSAVCEKMGGLFLGKCEDEKEICGDSVFLRSELPPPAEANKPTLTGGIFIRSADEATDDWVIA